MGPQGSGGTLNLFYSAREMLKALVSSEGRTDVLLWYLLVGALVGLAPIWVWQGLVRPGCRKVANAWYGVERPSYLDPRLPAPGRAKKQRRGGGRERKQAGSVTQGHGSPAGEGEQARRVKTVKVQNVPAGAAGADRRFISG